MEQTRRMRWVLVAILVVALVAGFVAVLVLKSGGDGGCPKGMASLPAGAIEEPGAPREDVAAFCMDRTEVTVAAYEACARDGKCPPAQNQVSWENISDADRQALSPVCNAGKPDRQNHPMNCVTWQEADAYCRSQGKLLPSDAQWKWAKGGAERKTEFPWGNDAPGARACWNGDGNDLGKGQRKGTCEVGSHPAGDSPQGVKDLVGNVYEWTQNGPEANPGTHFDLGGSWDTAVAPDLLSSYTTPEATRDFGIGFRCVKAR